MNHKITIRLAILVSLLTVLILNSCGPTEPTEPTVDKTPPSAIADLAIDSVRNDTTYLSWTATGDDGNSGRASSYDIRYAVDSTTLAAWSSANPVTHSLEPASSGASEKLAIHLAGGDSYYFAIKVADDSGNISSISNIVHNSVPRLDIGEKQTSGAGCASMIVPILAYNCDDIVGIELHIQFSAGTVTFDSLRSSLLNDELVNMTDGTIHLAWANINSAVSLSSGDTLALIYFSNLTGICNLTFSAGCELVNSEAETLPAVYDDGSIECN